MLPKKLQHKIEKRKNENAFRQLGASQNLVDFSSNDYLGFSKSENIFNNAHEYLVANNLKANGATGSRLLTGNQALYNSIEDELCNFHKTEAALIFNSGYDANIGFFSTVPQRGDIILYDEYSHASIRDGIGMSNAKAFKFRHNDLQNLDEILKRVQHDNDNTFIVTESVFSMDGDAPDLKALVRLCKTYNAYLIIDEAHAIGVFEGGLIQKYQLENDVFARIITYGKAMGCHGAAVLGSKGLKDYLINFSRPFIYTTGLPPHSLATIKMVYEELKSETSSIKKLHQNIAHFQSEINRLQLQKGFIQSNSAIHCCILSGNTKVKRIAQLLQDKGFNVKPILSPTVPERKERLRFCLHSYNSEKEISEVLVLLANFVNI